MKFRQKVKKHTEGAGRASHFENDPEGGRREISYAVFDCTHCDEEGIASMADFDDWDEVWPSVESHLREEHPEEI